jgi:cytochrome P450
VHHVEAASLCVGLLLAATSGPSVGAAQTLLLLLQHHDELQLVHTEMEQAGTLVHCLHACKYDRIQ